MIIFNLINENNFAETELYIQCITCYLDFCCKKIASIALREKTSDVKWILDYKSHEKTYYKNEKN